MSDADLLFLPIEKELISRDIGGDLLFFNVPATASLKSYEAADFVHFMKPHYDDLEQSGLRPQKCIPDNKSYDRIFYKTEKSAQATQFYLAYLLSKLNERGDLIVLGRNDENGKRLEKWFKELGLNPQSVSKKKSRIVTVKKEKMNEDDVQKIIEEKKSTEAIDGEQKFLTHPGIFSAKKIDKGSHLLAENLPSDLSGKGADFGCGYGFLASQILDGGVEEMHLLEADARALSCCQKNLEKFSDNLKMHYHWFDLKNKPDINSLDFIVMNPPFHEGKKQDSDLGQKFIINAAQCLKKNGVLYIVANVFLPYEKILSEYYSNVEKLTEQDGFKVFRAMK